jgi:hypothetical protein
MTVSTGASDGATEAARPSTRSTTASKRSVTVPPRSARTNYDESRAWGDRESYIETWVNAATNDGGNMEHSRQLCQPSQDNASFHTKESLDRGHNVGDLGDRAVGGTEVSCQGKSEMDRMSAVSTHSVARS